MLKRFLLSRIKELLGIHNKRYYISHYGEYLLVSYDNEVPEAFLKNDKTGVYEKQTLQASKQCGQMYYENVPNDNSRRYYIVAYDTQTFMVFVKGIAGGEFSLDMREICLKSVSVSDDGKSIRLI